MERQRKPPVDVAHTSIEELMADTPKTAANKSSALRWAVGLVVVLALGVIAWLATGYRGQSTLDSAPQHQSGSESNSGTSQPPAVTPNQDAGKGKPIPTPPASEGTTQ
jgi:cell division septation protein DedD